jgi:YD repeat-containing protein
LRDRLPQAVVSGGEKSGMPMMGTVDTNTNSTRKFLILCALFVVLGAMSRLLSAQAAIQYFYDDIGRLTKVIDQNGNVATYTYDAVGNLLSIARSTVSLTGIAIFAFTPQSGPAGQTVTIQGQGFSTSLSSNTVKFNGIPATVTAATSTSLTVTVPASAQSGLISVSVSSQSANSDTSFTVTSGAITAISVLPSGPLYLQSGTQQQFTATATFANGTQQDITTSAAWSSSNPVAAAISNTTGSNGLATLAGTGLTTITAASGAVSGSTTASVLTSFAVTPANVSILKTPQAQQQQFAATAVIGTPQTLTQTATWSSSNPSVATISNAAGTQGLATVTGVGTTTINATLGSIIASTSFTLTPPVPSSLAITPLTVSVQPGNAFQFTATVTLTDGTTQNVTQNALWSTSNASVATISNAAGSQGLANAVAEGTTVVTATYSSLSNSATLVVPSPLGSVVPRFVYENNPNGTISIYSVNPTTGQLRSLGITQGQGQSLAFALDPTSKYLYVANTFSNTVSAYSVGSNGYLSVISGSPFATGNYPNAIAVDPMGRFVYVVNGSDDTVSAFNVGSGGTLTPVSGSPFAVGRGPAAAVEDSSGKFLYVTNTTDSTVSALAISSTSGALTPISGSPFPTGVSPSQLSTEPSGQFLFVSNAGQSTGSELRIPSLRQKELRLRAGASASPRSELVSQYVGRALERRDQREYPLLATAIAPAALRSIADSKVDFAEPSFPSAPLPVPPVTGPSISVFTIGSSGGLTEASGSPFAVNASGWLSVDPADKYLYLTLPGSVYGFSFDSSGTLTALLNSPFLPGAAGNLSTPVMDPSGQFFYVAGSTNLVESSLNEASGNITSFGTIPSSSSSGPLVIANGSTPVSLVPTFAYVASGGGLSGANSVSAYSIAATTGVLTPLASSPFSEGFSPTAATNDPLGRFLFVANTCSDSSCAGSTGSVSSYTIDASSGVLAGSLGSPFASGTQPVGVAVDPLTSLVYVVNSQDDSIFGYSITSATGVLAPASGSPVFSTMNGLIGVGVDSAAQRVYSIAKCSSCGTGSLFEYGYPLFGPTTSGQQVQPLQSLQVGPSPTSLTLDPAGWFAFITDSSTNSVYVYANLTSFPVQVTGSPFAAGAAPVAAAVDPTGRFLYVANKGSNNLSAFSIDPKAGSLMPISGTPVTTGSGPVAVTVDISGSFVYVVNGGGDNSISAYSINQTTGSLAAIPGSPFQTGSSPVSMVTVGSVQ